MTKLKFLGKVTQEMQNSGHTPSEWTKGRWGINSICQVCGAFVVVSLNDNQVQEMPTNTCLQECARLDQYTKEGNTLIWNWVHEIINAGYWGHKLKCDCGAATVGGRHSYYCDLYTE